MLTVQHTPLTVTWRAWIFWAVAIGLGQVCPAVQNEDEKRGGTVRLEFWLAAYDVKVKKQVFQLAAEAEKLTFMMSVLWR